MRPQDKRNLINAWPMYVLLIVLAALTCRYYLKNPLKNANKSLDDVISHNLDPTGLKSIVNGPKRGWDAAYRKFWGQPAGNLAYTTIAGQTGKLRDLRGKTVLVVFWATWCPSCRQEISHLITLRNEFSAEELEIVAISSESPDTVKSFAAMEGINYTVVAGDFTVSSPFDAVLNIPSSFFIDKNGIVKTGAIGNVPAEKLSQIVTAIQVIQ